MDRTLWKNTITSYAGWFTNSLRRRRSILFGLILSILLFVVCIQYNTSNDIGIQSIQNTIVMSEFDGDEQPSNKYQSPAPISGTVRKMKNEEDVNFIEELQQPARKSRRIQINSELQQSLPYVPPQRLVHIDFKGAPPKLLYLQQLFPLIKRFGGTGLLLEWEDMFPWSGNLSPIAASNAYSKADIREILKMAAINGLEVIPLIQTFGHVEFALKLHDFAHLREVQESPQALCPSFNASMKFVEQMVDQILEIHGNVNYLHIGCDEVFHMGECFRCRSKAREDLFLSHVKQVATYVRTKSPNTIPIIWDDMLRHLPLATMQLYDIGKLVEPMVWVYAEDVYRFVMQNVWEKYQIVFPNVWTASAFKGAFGETLYVPNVKRHLENNLNWLQLMSNENSRFTGGFKGIVITGWQRYDHFAVLCEVLPSSIPSMVVNLLATTNGYMNQSLQTDLNEGLNCGIFGHNNEYDGDFLNLNNDPHLWEQFSRCTFPGNTFFRLLYRLHNIELDYNEFILVTKKNRGWMTSYNVEHEFSSPLRVDELMNDHSRIYRSLLSLVRPFQESMTGIFDKYTISEWIEQRIYPMIREMEKIHNEARELKSKKTWPKRPLPMLKELLRIGVTERELSTPSNDGT
ncbi:hexosaminidase D [Melanaphis sacchari]|uniref:beta-N-acetylhexosaminidase n=1 Tax=Melanaphis sacchari TaxID=742174 RepID=A0A2H8TQX9_9HEMI|nr:hexosaminidase D [Melanaphis sacchari]